MSASEMTMLEEELNELRTEVERLRGECGQAYLQGVKAGRDAERISERAVVVAWLREAAYTTLYDARAWDVADAIERGEYRKGEE